MNPIFTALAQGYGEDDILRYMMKVIPKIAPRIEKAKKSGHSSRKILDYFSKNMSEETTKDYQASNIITGRKKQEAEELTTDLLNKGLRLGSMAFGAHMLSRTAPHLLSRFPLLSNLLGDGAEAEVGAEVAGEATAPVAEAIGGAAEVAKSPIEELGPKAVDLIDQMKFGKLVEQLGKQGEEPSIIAGALNKFLSPEQKKWLGEQTKASIEDLVTSYLSQKAGFGKANEVITPDGDIGTIEQQPGETAKLDIDGKKKVFRSEDLTPIPENNDEILDLYERLIAAIPEEYRSSMLNWVGYDAGQKLLQVKFHTGDSYTYENVPEEFARKLENVLFIAKTTGGNFYGNWAQGEESRGAGVSALIRELQKKYGRGQEYSAKFKEVYSFFGLPEEKKRQKEKREREEKKKKKRS